MKSLAVALVAASLALVGCDTQESSTTTTGETDTTTEIDTSATPDTDAGAMSTTSTM